MSHNYTSYRLTSALSILMCNIFNYVTEMLCIIVKWKYVFLLYMTYLI